MMIAVLSLFMFAGTAQAYIGPGLGGGLVGALLAVLSGIFMLLLGVVYYPLKKLFGLRRKSKTEPVERKRDHESP